MLKTRVTQVSHQTILSSCLQQIGYIITYDTVDHKSDRQDSYVQEIVDHGAIHVATVAPSLPSCGPCLHSTNSTMTYQRYAMARQQIDALIYWYAKE